MVKRRVRLTDENDPLNSTDQVLAEFEQVSQTEGHQSKKSASQEPNNLDSQVVEKSKPRKSTFQINADVLNQLDQLHLRLQLELGKANAPYKEVIVEEAIAKLLEYANTNITSLMEALRERQRSRN